MSGAKRLIATVVVLLAATFFVPYPVRGQDQPVRRIGSTGWEIVVHGKKIQLDVYLPDKMESSRVRVSDPTTPFHRHPCALVLHGAGGILFDGPEMRRVARELAAHGVCAYVVHYFDGSGVTFTTSDRVLNEHFNQWLEVVEAALAFVQSQQGQPGQPVGIYGYSMGAFLGIAASSNQPKVGALAEQAGGVWNNEMHRVGRMPPVLMIHGRNDRRVPFLKFAVPFARTLRQRGGEVETRFFDHEGHGFTPVAQAQARTAVAEFLRRQLTTGNSRSVDGKPVRQAGSGAIPS